MYRDLVRQLVTDTASVRQHEKYWRESSLYADVLHQVYPQGHREGSFFRIGAEGEAGRRVVFNLDSGKWSDFADDDAGSDTGSKGLVSFVWYIDGWEGIKNLAATIELPFDWVIHTGMLPDERPIHAFAGRRGLTVARKWEYRDLDDTYLGTRVRFEDKHGDKQFRLLAYRTRKILRDPGGNRSEYPEGWRLDGDWGPLDPLYGLEKIASNTKPYLLVEGEKACDAASELVGDSFCTLTWGGGASTKVQKAAWSLLPRDKEVFYWPDNDQAGKKTLPKIGEIFPSLKLVDVWSLGSLEKGWDLADLDPTKSTWAIEMLTKSVFVSSMVSKIANTTGYIYVKKTEEFIHLDTGHRYTPKMLARAHAHEVEDLDVELLSDPRTIKVYCPTYWPGKPRIVSEMDEFGNMLEKINLWREGGCEATSGDCDKFFSHMEFLVPDEEVRDHIYDFMAHIVQKPGDKIHWAILMMGKQGVGKSYLLEVIKQLTGPNNTKEVTNNELCSDFNGWAECVQVIAVEEVMAGGRRETTNRLKPLITSPTLQINDKGTKIYDIVNRLNMVLFSNEDDPLTLDEDDRRFLVYKTPMVKQSDQYYNDLFSSIENEAPALKGWLEARDLSAFNPKGRAPMTSDKQDLISMSESMMVSNIRLYIEARRTPFDRDVVSLLDVCDWVRINLRSVSKFDSSPKNIRASLIQLGAVSMGTTDDGMEKTEKFSIRNHEMFGSVLKTA